MRDHSSVIPLQLSICVFKLIENTNDPIKRCMVGKTFQEQCYLHNINYGSNSIYRIGVMTVDDLLDHFNVRSTISKLQIQ